MSAFTLNPLPARLPSLEPLPRGAKTVVVDEAHSYPCRRCLRDAEPGEQVVLLSYDPFDDATSSAYRQPGPIFVHAEPCAYEPSDTLPDQLTRRLLSVRSFAADHAMQRGVVIQGVELRETVERLLADESVAYLHVHNAGPGCFATRIDRAA
jgi:hypothetical protein